MLKHVLLALAATLGLTAGDPPTKPILRVETGMHTAPINRIAADPTGRLLATASEDKTLRLWDAESGALIRTIRPPIDPGIEGRLYACAFSPDGQILAASGYTGRDWDGTACIYLFEVATGAMQGRITGLPRAAMFLTYARDGRLGACLGEANGIRVFHPDGREAFRDIDYGNFSTGADFDESGRFVTTCFDGWVRLYGADGSRLAKAHVGGSPTRVRFSPNSPLVAVGFNEAPRVELRSGLDLSLQGKPDVSKTTGGLSEVAWSTDGKTLYGFGGVDARGWPHIRAWSNGGKGACKEFRTGEDSGRSLAPLSNGKLAWASSDPAWGVLDGPKRGRVTCDFRNGGRLDLNASGSCVGFSLFQSGIFPARFNAASREMTVGPFTLSPPRTTFPGLEVTDWKHDESPKLNGQPILWRTGETARALAFLPDGAFLLGGQLTLNAFDPHGQRRWQHVSPGIAWGVNASADGTLAVAAYGDGTIRWHRASDGQELLAFFPHTDGKRWVAWTPSGYYDCSPGGEDLIGWHVNRGKDQAADFFPASRFRSTYYKPELISKVLELKDEAQALAALGGRTDTSIATLLPPVVRILSPGPGVRATSATVQVRASVRPPNGQAIDTVWAAVDGRRVDLRGLRPQQAEGAEKLYTLDVPVPAQDCTVSVFAQSGSAVSEAATLRLAWAGAVPGPAQPSGPTDRPGAFVIQPKLYILAVGVGTYQRAELKLDFPGKDARDLSAAFQRQKGKLYRDVEVRLLADAQATKENILDGLEWLERQVTAKDVAVMFLAGHGINDTGGQYYFLPTDADPDRIKRTMLADSDVRSTLAKLPGKVLFFLDTCHSGNVLGQVKTRGAADLNGFINELSSAENGVVVFSASTGKQSSQESPEWGNGAFTKALVEGLSGKADFQKTGRITLNMLDLYLSERVKELTKGTQAPTTAKPTNVPDFPVAITR